MACNLCGKPRYSCNCQVICDPCNNNGCPIQLDASCVFYHKNNNEVSELTNLGLTNGATLELILETIDVKLEGLNVLDWELDCLRDDFTINTLQQFAQAVDTKICQLSACNCYAGSFETVEDGPVDLSNGNYYYAEEEDVLVFIINGEKKLVALDNV